MNLFILGLKRSVGFGYKKEYIFGAYRPHHYMNCRIYNVWFIEFHLFLFKLKNEYPNTSGNDGS